MDALLTHHGVVPDVLAPFATKMELHVSYAGGLKAHGGNELTPRQVKDQPVVTWAADPAKHYTLVMTDPDAPSRSNPVSGEFVHWVVVNIPGGDVAKGEVKKGYIGSGPPPNTGLHRYIFVLYEQAGKLDASDMPTESSHAVKSRPKFKLSKWAHDHGLGSPIAVNFYQAQHDDWVPELYKTFTA